MPLKPILTIATTKAGREARRLLVEGILGRPTSLCTPEMLDLQDVYHAALRGEKTEAELAEAIAKAKAEK